MDGLSIVLLIPADTVEVDDEDVKGSWTDESPRSSGVWYLTTEGLPCNGLICRVRAIDLVLIAIPGE